jgi:hypothetical protein
MRFSKVWLSWLSRASHWLARSLQRGETHASPMGEVEEAMLDALLGLDRDLLGLDDRFALGDEFVEALDVEEHVGAAQLAV